MKGFLSFHFSLNAKDYFGITSLKPDTRICYPWGDAPSSEHVERLSNIVRLFRETQYSKHHPPGEAGTRETEAGGNELQEKSELILISWIILLFVRSEMTFISANPIWVAKIFIFRLSGWRCCRERERDGEQEETVWWQFHFICVFWHIAVASLLLNNLKCQHGMCIHPSVCI